MISLDLPSDKFRTFFAGPSVGVFTKWENCTMFAIFAASGGGGGGAGSWGSNGLARPGGGGGGSGSFTAIMLPNFAMPAHIHYNVGGGGAGGAGTSSLDATNNGNAGSLTNLTLYYNSIAQITCNAGGAGSSSTSTTSTPGAGAGSPTYNTKWSQFTPSSFTGVSGGTGRYTAAGDSVTGRFLSGGGGGGGCSATSVATNGGDVNTVFTPTIPARLGGVGSSSGGTDGDFGMSILRQILGATSGGAGGGGNSGDGFAGGRGGDGEWGCGGGGGGSSSSPTGTTNTSGVGGRGGDGGPGFLMIVGWR